jgi:hypothetical protein
MSMRRLFLEVREAAGVVRGLGVGLFVRNGLGLVIGEQLLLALRLPRFGRALDIPVVVVGRRLHRPGTMLSAGVVVRAVDVDHPVLVALRDALVADADRAGDIDVAVLLRRLRLPARVAFSSLADAARALGPVIEGEGAVDVGLGFVRGDRLALDVVVCGAVFAAGVVVLARGIRIVDDEAFTVVCAGDDDALVTLRALCGVDGPAQEPSPATPWLPLARPVGGHGALA